MSKNQAVAVLTFSNGTPAAVFTNRQAMRQFTGTWGHMFRVVYVWLNPEEADHRPTRVDLPDLP